MRRILRLTLLLSLLLPLSAASAQSGWKPVREGIDYRLFRLPGPNRAHVARMDRSEVSLTLETALPDGTLYGELGTVREIAERAQGTLTAWKGGWGTRSDVAVAINGAFFNTETGELSAGMVESGW